MKKIVFLFLSIGCILKISAGELPFIAEGFPSTMGGVLYSEATRAAYIQPPVDLAKYEVIGPVTAKAKMENVLLLVNWGDTSLQKLKAEAKNQYPMADDIVNIEIDAVYFNVLCFYMKTTVIMRGIAVKYKK